jgi:hypothetical protein
LDDRFEGCFGAKKDAFESFYRILWRADLVAGWEVLKTKFKG